MTLRNKFSYLVIVLLVMGIGSLRVVAGQESDSDSGVALPRESTDVEIAATSTDIFVGRIEAVLALGIAQQNSVASVGAAAVLDCGGPCPGYMTVYQVTVLEVIKGNLRLGQTIEVEQEGGVDGEIVSFYQGDGPMLPGDEYLLATRLIRAYTDWYAITGPGKGNILLATTPERDAQTERWRQIIMATPCGLTDVLMLNGTIYGRRDWSRDQPFLNRDQVGKVVSEITRRVSEFNPCLDEMNNGDATLLAVGTNIQQLKTYDPKFRLVVKRPDGNYYLFEALWNEFAQTAADLYDIDGRVVSIQASNYTDCTDIETCVHPPQLRENVDIGKIVERFLTSPIDSSEIVRASYAATHSAVIVFNLEDGSNVVIWYGGAHRSTLSGIQIYLEIVREL